MPLQYKEGLAFKLVGVWERWDACWYAHIATTGYQGDGSTAFFPLFPALERVVALFGPHVVIAGMIVDLVAAVLALWGIHRIVEDDHGRDVARRAILLLSVFPASLFLVAPFSEAILLAASVWSLDFARRGGWSAAAACAFLAALARPVGVVLVLPLLWTAWRRRAEPEERVAAAVAVVAAPAAFGAFVLYTQRVVGVSMFAASALWTGSAYHPPWDVLAAALDWTRRRGDPLEALELALLVGATALLIVGAARLRADLSLYAAPQIAFLWLRILPTPLTSTSRYLLVVFPAFVVLALLLERRRALWSYAIVSLLLLAAIANELVIGDFVG
ncbi:MAG: hypothetical protein KGJ98_01710 [Chloroflexota bacterium]|nr:hypothetical protein [Chloroflexota bacterium]MDE3100930.1 hypothetical protein [Chloroflexota bacterium]